MNDRYSPGRRATELDEVIRVDEPPLRHPQYEDGSPILLYDAVRIKGEPGLHRVTDIRVRCFGWPGREQTWAGRRRDGQPGDRFYDRRIEQVWIELDGENRIRREGEIERA